MVHFDGRKQKFMVRAEYSTLDVSFHYKGKVSQWQDVKAEAIAFAKQVSDKLDELASVGKQGRPAHAK